MSTRKNSRRSIEESEEVQVVFGNLLGLLRSESERRVKKSSLYFGNVRRSARAATNVDITGTVVQFAVAGGNLSVQTDDAGGITLSGGAAGNGFTAVGANTDSTGALVGITQITINGATGTQTVELNGGAFSAPTTINSGLEDVTFEPQRHLSASLLVTATGAVGFGCRNHDHRWWKRFVNGSRSHCGGGGNCGCGFWDYFNRQRQHSALTSTQPLL